MRKIILGLVPALLSIPAAAYGAQPWTVSEVSGEVRVTHDGSSRAAVRGALLASGAAIVTGPAGRAVIVRGDEFVVVSPATRLRVPAEDNPNAIVQMIEDFGTAIFKIKKKSTPHFGVQTPYLAAVVKGTTFTVSVGPEGGSVQVTEGAVEVSTLDGGASDIIAPGGIASVGADDLYQLSIDGDVSKVIRSDKVPEGTVTSGLQGVAPYTGSTGAAEIRAPIAENQQALGDITGGLVSGDAAIEFAMAQVGDTQPRPSTHPGPNETGGSEPDIGTDTGTPDDGGSGGTGNSGGGNPGSGGDDGNNGHGNDPDGNDEGNPGNGEDPGTGDDGDAGSGGDDGNNGHGNDGDGDDAGNPGNGGEDPGTGDGGDAGSGGDDGNNGHGNDPDGDDAGNPGNGGEDPGTGDDGDAGSGGDDGNNGHGNDPDGEDDGNPGQGGIPGMGGNPGKGANPGNGGEGD